MKKREIECLCGERGSVLMEFVIVLPIYFLLLGFAFVIGELSLHTIHLSAVGDRNVAFVEDDTNNLQFWRRLRRVLSPNRDAIKRSDTDSGEEDFLLSYKGDEVYQGKASVSQFNETLDNKAQNAVLPGNGHWTEAVAGRAIDDYTLSPVTRGVVAHWFYETEKRVYEGGMMSETLDRPEKDDLDEILDKTRSTLGRAKVKGNYYEDNEGKRIRHYGYQTLRRRKEARAGNSYRDSSAGALADEGLWLKAKDSEEILAQIPDADYGIRESDSAGDELGGAGKSSGGGSAVGYDFKNLL